MPNLQAIFTGISKANIKYKKFLNRKIEVRIKESFYKLKLPR